jgi:hypothetical protein
MQNLLLLGLIMLLADMIKAAAALPTLAPFSIVKSAVGHPSTNPHPQTHLD